MWFYIATNVALNILLFTPFNERSIRGTFPAESKVILWHSPPVAIQTRSKRKEKKMNVQDVYDANPNDENESDTEVSSRVRIPRKVVLKPIAKHKVLVSAISFGLITAGPHHLRRSNQQALAVRGKMENSPD